MTQLAKIIEWHPSTAGFGSSVAVSSDGTTALVGAPLSNNAEGSAIGAVFVFDRSGCTWTEETTPLVPTGAAGVNVDFGRAVAVSGDGNSTLVGSPGDSGNTGAIYAFVRTAGGWTQQGPKLTVTDPAVFFGRNLCLSADGNSAVVGAGAGVVYFFARSGTTWTQQGAKVLCPDAGVGGFGGAIAMSGDGNTSVIAATTSPGFLYFYRRVAGTWALEGSAVPNPGPIGTGFGTCVALSSDGNAAAIGAPIDNGGVGAIYIFVHTGSGWAQQGPKLVPVDGAGPPNLGGSISLSGDGSTVIGGGVNDDAGNGAVFVFGRTGSIWAQRGPKLVADRGVFGYSITLSADASTAVLSAYGLAYMFAANPVIAFTQQPADATVNAGGNAIFTSATTSYAPVTYQWQRHGSNLTDGPTGTGSVVSGSTTPILTVSNVSASDASLYDCVASNACGSTPSVSAVLFVNGSTPTTGACCHGVACSITTGAACTGAYLGDGAACAPVVRGGGRINACCPADFNGTGGLTVADVFVFLDAWFAGCP